MTEEKENTLQILRQSIEVSNATIEALELAIKPLEELKVKLEKAIYCRDNYKKAAAIITNETL